MSATEVVTVSVPSAAIILQDIPKTDLIHAISVTDLPDGAQLERKRDAPASVLDIDSESDTDSKLGMELGSSKKFSFKEIPRNRGRLFATCWIIVSIGLNDGSVGALLPQIEAYYNINYAIVSTIWLANSIGFITIAVVTHWLYSRLGRVGMFVLGTAFLTMAFAILAPGPPFGAVLVAFFLSGLGAALVNSQANVFVSYLQHTEAMFGVMHGSYGVGATFGPLIATAMVDKGMLWSHYYFILLGMNFMGVIFAFYFFQGCDKDLGTDYLLHKSKKEKAALAEKQAMNLEAGIPYTSEEEGPSIFKQAIRSKTTWLAAFVLLFYQGAEVSIGGWIVSFIIETRHGNSSTSGYIASGFWAGVTLGRFVLNPIIPHLTTPYRAIWVLIAFAIAFEFCTWFLPTVLSSAVTVAIVGLFVGPMCPSALSAVSDILPRRIQTVSLSITSAFGSTGGALWPFVTGILAQTVGTYVVHPVAIALFFSMAFMWCFVPYNVTKRLAAQRKVA
ncbi:major facilitator superfamily domain-containing protein [Limtongia smithiae]|uniref:major facilitator superfamily domain-containing protein n=1 Tax=Limtongia smithiae TaxID=1125753 RepID=UPI0034CDD610